MGWLISVCHRSGYQYRGDVLSSYNEARMTSMTTPAQVTVEASLSVAPRVRPYRYVDYWGSIVHAFDIHRRHTALEVTATSVVETSPHRRPAASLGWHDLAAGGVLDAFGELLTPTRFVPFDPAMAEVAHELASGRSPDEAVDAVVAWVGDRLTYAKGVTRVLTSAVEVFARRRGVCQDHAHLTLALLRAMGVPARYASGYLHPTTDAATGDTVTGESHAWVEAWTGDWHPLDPTSGAAVGERHVLVARGRDYADVAPLRGVYHGGPAEDLTVDVTISRLA